MTTRRSKLATRFAWVVCTALLLAASAGAADENAGSSTPSGPAVLSGHVYLDIGPNRQVAQNVTITLYNRTSQGQVSALNFLADNNGYYAIPQLQPGKYIMFAQLKGYNMGCASNGITIDFTAKPLVQDIDLNPEGNKLYCPAVSPSPAAS